MISWISALHAPVMPSPLFIRKAGALRMWRGKEPSPGTDADRAAWVRWSRRPGAGHWRGALYRAGQRRRMRG